MTNAMQRKPRFFVYLTDFEKYYVGVARHEATQYLSSKLISHPTSLKSEAKRSK